MADDTVGGVKLPKKLLEDVYRPPKEIQEAIFDVYDYLIKWRSLREQSYKQFNGQAFSDWLQESREKFWGYLPISSDLDTPQFFFPETRNQVGLALAKVAGLKMKPHFDGVEGFDMVTATILKDLFESWRRSSNKKIRSFWQFLYTVVNGTCVVFVGYRSKKHKVKNIEYYDPATGETRFKEEMMDDSDVFDEICNLEDIYIPKPWEQDIQEQGRLIWRTLLTWKDFKSLFKAYDLMEMVMPGMQFADASIFTQFMSYDVRGGDFVEVIRYFDVEKDRYMIIANGVLLNPIKEKGDKQSISPMPWNHKKLPFAKTVFEPIDASFFYGLSLPQKIKTPQEALNWSWELMMERERRAVSAPILTNDPTIELGLEFKPGRVYQVGVDPSQYKEMQMAPVSSSYWNMISSLQGIITKTGSGGAPGPSGKQPRSATEKASEERQKEESAGLYFMFYQDLIEQIAWLAIQNQIQFYTAEKTEKIIGQRKFNKILSLIDVQLNSGGMGNHEVRITSKIASNEELQKEAWYRSLFKKERVEIIEVTPEMLRQVKFDVKIDFEKEDSPDTERALYLDFVATLEKLFGQIPGLLDPKKLMFRLIEKFGEDISDVVPDNLIQDYEKERFGFPGQQQQLKPLNAESLPQANALNQQMRGQQFGAQGPANAMAGAGLPNAMQGATPPAAAQPPQQ